MKRIVGTIAAAAAVTLSAAACQGGVTTPATGGSSAGTSSPAAAPTGGATTGSGSSPVTYQPPATSPARADPATSGHGLCVDANSGVVEAAIKSLGPGVGGEGYVFSAATDAPIGSCPALLWVLVDTPNATASSPWHVLFFNHDRYLGTATRNHTSYTRIVGSSDRSVQVQYRWLQDQDANCCPSGGPVVITFTLGADGQTITPDRPIPPEVAR
ncbi:LppP/LprE family lipoprotein [Nocardia sp. CDC159]|uniref:LppP/LprE family lipoprotein n=1 Tax=Nocardia pulmonis TaxID=2951408 RepID=A0A9X2E7C0_9NOCA|nr:MULTISPECIES: LppP/LprE family lipoprotein [Nocardia]MCM6775589.1 LppP/LprE family lipoprotein [Nocardia pulmonis]MCM6787677.1 LppP/LprE family lipoprotein [Nocardia sp. CDC159]